MADNDPETLNTTPDEFSRYYDVAGET